MLGFFWVPRKTQGFDDDGPLFVCIKNRTHRQRESERGVPCTVHEN